MFRTEGNENIAQANGSLVSVFQTVGGAKSKIQQDAFLAVPADGFDRASLAAMFASASDELERTLLEKTWLLSGTTGVLAFADSDGTVTTAHVGDSRATLFIRDPATNKITALPLTADHNVDRTDEQRRIAVNPAYEIRDHRLWDRVVRPDANGVNHPWWISMTRAFGDAVWKDVVIHEPEVRLWRPTDFAAENTELYLAVDSDGAHFDITAEERAAGLENWFRDPGTINPAQALAETALAKGSPDNITVLFTRLARRDASPLALGVFDGHGKAGHDVALAAATIIGAILQPSAAPH